MGVGLVVSSVGGSTFCRCRLGIGCICLLCSFWLILLGCCSLVGLLRLLGLRCCIVVLVVLGVGLRFRLFRGFFRLSSFAMRRP